MKYKLFVLFVLAALLYTGCGKENDGIQEERGRPEKPEIQMGQEAEADKGTGGRQEAEPEPKPEGPEPTANYKRESESGKVKFDCKIETPDYSAMKNNVHKFLLTGKYYGDEKSMFSKYVEGKEISEKHESTGGEGVPDSVFYIMEDGTAVDIGAGFTYGTGVSKHYSYIGVLNSENQEEYSSYSSGKVSFVSEEEAIEAVKKEMDEIGFSEFEIQFEAYPVSHEVLEDMENLYIEEGSLREEKKKDAWTQEDDAYAVYGYQAKGTLPVMHQWMSLYGTMGFYNVDNAPVSAIYSSRGIEMLFVNHMYYFEDTGETVALKEFDEIAGVVEEKFESILNDASYVVDRAKLFQMVRLNEKQEYVADPVWYFEVAENGESRSVTLVDAATGKEIYME